MKHVLRYLVNVLFSEGLIDEVEMKMLNGWIDKWK